MKKQGRKYDVYSFGLLMWEIATQIAPWCDENAALVSDLVRQGLRPSLNGIDKGAPGWFVPLIEQCWSQDPEERPTFIHISETFQTGILLPVAKNVVEVEPTINESGTSVRVQFVRIGVPFAPFKQATDSGLSCSVGGRKYCAES